MRGDDPADQQIVAPDPESTTSSPKIRPGIVVIAGYGRCETHSKRKSRGVRACVSKRTSSGAGLSIPAASAQTRTAQGTTSTPFQNPIQPSMCRAASFVAG